MEGCTTNGRTEERRQGSRENEGTEMHSRPLMQIRAGQRDEQHHVRDGDDARHRARLDGVVDELRDEAVGALPGGRGAVFGELRAQK